MFTAKHEQLTCYKKINGGRQKSKKTMAYSKKQAKAGREVEQAEDSAAAKMMQRNEVLSFTGIISRC